MALEIKVLDLIDIELESSFLVLGRNMGITSRASTWGHLILGGDDPILVDTRASGPEIMTRPGMTGYVSQEQRLESPPGRYGLPPKDIRRILPTPPHTDHPGPDDRLPSSTTVVINP